MKKIVLIIISLSILSVLCLKAQEKVIEITSDPENLGEKINTDYTESDTRISPDGSTLYFIRWKSPDNLGGEDAKPDIYYSELDENGEWQLAQNLGEPFNDEDFNMVVGIRPDGNAMIIKAKYNEEFKTNLYITYKKSGKWQNLAPMEFEDMDYKINDRGYSVSSDFKTLIFADKEKGKDGKADLFVSFFQDNSKWSKPLYMGTDINTDSYDEWPILANDNETVYYTTSGFEGFGSGDIYLSRRLDDTWTKWSTPVNMGEKINTENYDADFVVDTQGKYAYLSLIEGTKLDIFRILLSEEAKPKPVVLVKGKVFNQTTKEPLEVEVVYYNMTTNKELGKAYSDKSTGGYKIVLPYGEKYSLMAKTIGYASVSDNLDLTKGNKNLDQNLQYQEITKDLYLVPIETGNIVRMNNLFFETNKAEINKDSYLELENIIKLLNENPTMKVEIQGHTDNVGSEATNMNLSKKRADAVKAYLIVQKIGSSRITTKGFGEGKPVTSNSTPEGRRKNRRVEFKIMEK